METPHKHSLFRVITFLDSDTVGFCGIACVSQVALVDQERVMAASEVLGLNDQCTAHC